MKVEGSSEKTKLAKETDAILKVILRMVCLAGPEEELARHVRMKTTNAAGASYEGMDQSFREVDPKRATAANAEKEASTVEANKRITEAMKNSFYTKKGAVRRMGLTKDQSDDHQQQLSDMIKYNRRTWIKSSGGTRCTFCSGSARLIFLCCDLLDVCLAVFIVSLLN